MAILQDKSLSTTQVPQFSVGLFLSLGFGKPYTAVNS